MVAKRLDLDDRKEGGPAAFAHFSLNFPSKLDDREKEESLRRILSKPQKCSSFLGREKPKLTFCRETI